MILDKCNSDSKQLVSKGQLATVVAESSAEVVIMLGAGDIDVLVQDVVDALQLKQTKGALKP
jgi:hypothetical protein